MAPTVTRSQISLCPGSYQYGPTFLMNAFSTLLNQWYVRIKAVLKAKGGQTQYKYGGNVLGTDDISQIHKNTSTEKNAY